MNMQRCRVVAVALMAALMVALVSVVDAQTECCSSCIGKPVDSPYDYDPISFEQCSVKQPGLVRVCCFKCGTWGEPTYGDAVGFASDGTTPTIKTGKWVSLQWSTATKVTFITLKDGQKKTVTPTLNDTAATVTDGYYMICARSKGSIIFRGWGKDSCREASPEKTVQVVEGDAGATCEAAAPTAPKVTKAPNSAGSSSQGEDPNIKNCNLNRASIKEVDGKQQCVCVNEWSGAPACDQMPTWKWIITIGGGIAALFSILISIHAFIKSRNKKKNEDDDEIPTPAPAKDDVEILRIGADRPSANNKAQHDQQTAYQRGFDNNHGVYKMNDREFSL